MAELCKKIGYQASDIGELKISRKLENTNNEAFSDWRWPSLISLLIFLFNFTCIAANYYFFAKAFKPLTEYIKNFALLSHTNKVLGFTSLQMLAMVYFGSIIASIFQLYNGTKYKLFPHLLDLFLRQRKQYGLWAFLFATLHAILTIYIGIDF